MSKQKLTLRPITEADLPFLNQLYHTTRDYEMAKVPWSAEQKEAFLTMQFEAQHRYYQSHYQDTAFDIIELNGRPIGRLYLQRRTDEFRIVDIAILPKYRRRGIGSRYLKQIMKEATEQELPVTIHVEADNPAMKLYLRLGFEHVDTNGIYHFMQWQPE